MELQEGGKAMRTPAGYMIKQDGELNVQGFKANQVGEGNHEIDGIYYQARNSPTARLGHDRLALEMASKHDLNISQKEVCTAFLPVDLEVKDL